MIILDHSKIKNKKEIFQTNCKINADIHQTKIGY